VGRHPRRLPPRCSRGAGPHDDVARAVGGGGGTRVDRPVRSSRNGRPTVTSRGPTRPHRTVWVVPTTGESNSAAASARRQPATHRAATAAATGGGVRQQRSGPLRPGRARGPCRRGGRGPRSARHLPPDTWPNSTERAAAAAACEEPRGAPTDAAYSFRQRRSAGAGSDAPARTKDEQHSIGQQHGTQERLPHD